MSQIELKGVRVHNLKNIDVIIPKNKLVVITGVSGSGKSSLLIDTLYAEGQRRYVESLNSYARQFLSRMNKPELDYIRGICPAIAIEQKVTNKNIRSTVGSMTEIYDYLRLLFSSIGETYSPISQTLVKEHSVTDVVDYIVKQPQGTAVYLVLPLEPKYKRNFADEIEVLIQKGFGRFMHQGNLYKLEEFATYAKNLDKDLKHFYYLLIDRYTINDIDEDMQNRISDSVLTAFAEGDGQVWVQVGKGDNSTMLHFNNKFEADGIVFQKPTPQFFNFNNSYGACAHCEGTGTVIGIDPNLVIPDTTLSVYEGAVNCWRGDKMQDYQHHFIKQVSKINFPIHRPIQDLSQTEYQLLWNGNQEIDGINQFFQWVETQTYKIQYRVMLSRYRGRTLCAECMGSRINKAASYVLINKTNIHTMMNMSLENLKLWFDNWQPSPQQFNIAKRIILEIKNRIGFMLEVGLGYLSLNRTSGTLSGGETQRINLTRTIGSNLNGSLYILDEPSVGLHPRDTQNLVKVLHRLRDLGNTVTVVEHEETIMRAADHIIDMGPEAGYLGGTVIAAGNFNDIINTKESLTGQYLSHKRNIFLNINSPTHSKKIQLKKCKLHNLKEFDVEIPMQGLTVVTGVSGSGKTTLIKHMLYPKLENYLLNRSVAMANTNNLYGDLHMIDALELIDQEPIGKSSRSNPVTYVKAFDDIRDLFAKQKTSQIRGYTNGTFSFNVDGGRCDTCKGEGEQTVSMQFLADVHLLCEDCNGKRYKSHVLEVQYKQKNIFEILEMTINEAVEFFNEQKNIYQKIKPLQDVGLGYVKMGQSANTLSGGEAQRVKLASYLVPQNSSYRYFFIFDEPTTGLHFHDIQKLLEAFKSLIDKGHTILVIEHNIDVIRNANYVIDLGPEGGEKGGFLLYQGPVDGLKSIKSSYTAQYL